MKYLIRMYEHITKIVKNEKTFIFKQPIFLK